MTTKQYFLDRLNARREFHIFVYVAVLAAYLVGWYWGYLAGYDTALGKS